MRWAHRATGRIETSRPSTRRFGNLRLRSETVGSLSDARTVEFRFSGFVENYCIATELTFEFAELPGKCSYRVHSIEPGIDLGFLSRLPLIGPVENQVATLSRAHIAHARTRLFKLKRVSRRISITNQRGRVLRFDILECGHFRPESRAHARRRRCFVCGANRTKQASRPASRAGARL